mmetsp:Transcript_22578/g.37114  ORF Transcript_22578/g.37114 Transcript_22578/m.37114 type:complete len:375 (-) Transcript_22578:69-1193(-)
MDLPLLTRLAESDAENSVDAAQAPEQGQSKKRGRGTGRGRQQEVRTTAGTDRSYLTWAEKQKLRERVGSQGSSSSATPEELSTPPAGSEVPGDMRFKVTSPLNLGLNLKLGKVYSADDLRSRCRSKGAKLERLNLYLAEQKKLVPELADSTAASSAPPSPSPAELPSGVAESTSAPSPLRRMLRKTSHSEAFGVEEATSRSASLEIEQPAPKRSKVTQMPKATQAVVAADAAEAPRAAETLKAVKETSKAPKGRGRGSESGPATAAKKPAAAEKLAPRAVQAPQACEASTAAEASADTPWVIGQRVWYRQAATAKPSWPARVRERPTTKQSSYTIQLEGDDQTVLARPSDLSTMQKADLATLKEIIPKILKEWV